MDTVALVPRTWISPTRRQDALRAVTDVIRDLIPFVQTGIKAADELRDRVALRLRQRSVNPMTPLTPARSYPLRSDSAVPPDPGHDASTGRRARDSSSRRSASRWLSPR
jgi:hypothetical protein